MQYALQYVTLIYLHFIYGCVYFVVGPMTFLYQFSAHLWNGWIDKVRTHAKRSLLRRF